MDSKYHSQWNCLTFQAHTILQQGNTWLLHSSHQTLLLKLKYTLSYFPHHQWSVWNAQCCQWLQWSLIWCSMSTQTLLSSLRLSSDPPKHHSVSLSICSHHSSPTNPSYPSFLSVTPHFTAISQPVSSLRPVICCVFSFLRSRVIYEMIPLPLWLVSPTHARPLIGWWDLSKCWS